MSAQDKNRNKHSHEISPRANLDTNTKSVSSLLTMADVPRVPDTGQVTRHLLMVTLTQEVGGAAL